MSKTTLSLFPLYLIVKLVSYFVDAKINNKSLAPHIHKNGKIEIINKIENIYDTHIAKMKKKS